MNWWGRSWELLEPNALHPRRTQWLCYFVESLWRIITCVNCSDAFIGDKTFPPLWLSYPKTEQKHFLNQGPGSSFLFELELCGWEEKEPSGGAAAGRTMSLKWRETTPSQSHQNMTTCWSAWILATGTDSDVSGEPCCRICWYRVFDPSMWTLSSAEIPLRHHAEAASQCSITPPVSLLLRTPVFPLPPWPRFYLWTQTLQRERWREQREEHIQTCLAPVCCLKQEHSPLPPALPLLFSLFHSLPFFLFVLTVPLLPEVFLSSSLSRFLRLQMWRICLRLAADRRNPYWHSI